ncbi:MAG: hypothetical protein AAF628_29060 [Planctomycetota bacterium]
MVREKSTAALWAVGVGFAATVAVPAQWDGYVDYGDYDLRRLLIVEEDAELGLETHRPNLELADRVLRDLERHAGEYPPFFARETERIRAERDLRMLAVVFDLLAERPDAEPGVLLRAGRIAALGHNLDVPGSAERATRHFETLLEVAPDHALGHFHYGLFLVSTATGHRDSLAHLQKALDEGVTDARYALGLAYLLLDDREASLEHFEVYAQQRPGHGRTRVLIRAIRAGTVNIEKGD